MPSAPALAAGFAASPLAANNFRRPRQPAACYPSGTAPRCSRLPASHPVHTFMYRPHKDPSSHFVFHESSIRAAVIRTATVTRAEVRRLADAISSTACKISSAAFNPCSAAVADSVLARFIVLQRRWQICSLALMLQRIHRYIGSLVMTFTPDWTSLMSWPCVPGLRSRPWRAQLLPSP